MLVKGATATRDSRSMDPSITAGVVLGGARGPKISITIVTFAEESHPSFQLRAIVINMREPNLWRGKFPIISPASRGSMDKHY